MPFPSPGDLSNLWTEAWSPVLQADSLPSEPPEACLTKAKIVDSQSLTPTYQTSCVACCTLWHHLIGRKPAAFMPLLVTSLLRYYNLFIYLFTMVSLYTSILNIQPWSTVQRTWGKDSLAEISFPTNLQQDPKFLSFGINLS